MSGGPGATHYCHKCDAYHEHGEHNSLPRRVPPVVKSATAELTDRALDFLIKSASGLDSGATKPSNPKDVIGSRKLHMSCVPWTLVVCAARALLEGVLKYGRFNWRMCGVRGSIYLDAIKRHIAKYENGQDADPKTLIHHLDSAIGCLAIMRDAMLYNKFTDDRPPCPDPDAMARLIDGEEELGAHLRDLFKDHTPHQFTIADTPSTRI